jgi:flagellar hook-associated protein 2
MSSNSSSISSLSSSLLRTPGLASGLDTTSIVNSLMKVARMPLDKLNQQKTSFNWKKDANLEVNNLLKTFRDDYLSATKKGNYMLSAANIKMNKVTMNTSTSAVTVTAAKDAYTGSHIIDSITSLASGANAASGARISATGLAGNTTLGALALNTPLDFSGGALSFSINGSTFNFNSTDTLQTVINRVNSDSTANVNMVYSSLTGKISIQSKTMGTGSSLAITNITGNAFSDINSAFGIAAGTYSNGTNAVLSIDSEAVTQATNNFTIDGMSFTLNETSGSAIRYSVSQDIDGAVTKIKSFVDDYNKLIKTLNDKIDEKPDTDYKPLTDSQKVGMSDDQVKQWEEKAKAGLLHNDSYITRLLSDVRGAFYDNVTDAGLNASAIGLSTGSYLNKGAIVIDEDKLRKALADNPDKVATLFTNTSTAADTTVKYNENGLSARILASINGYINDYQGYRTTSANNQMSSLNTSITNLTSSLQAKEDRYWKQFDALETAMQKMNAQSSWLTQQFSTNSSNQ